MISSLLVVIVNDSHEQCPEPGAVRVHGKYMYIREADYERLRTTLPAGHTVTTLWKDYGLRPD